MLDQIIFQTHISWCPFFNETIVVINSGKEVQRETIVSQIILDDTPKNSAIFTALSTTKFPHKVMAHKPPKIINNNIRIFLDTTGSNGSTSREW